MRAATLGNWFQQGCGLLAMAATIPFIIKHFDKTQVGIWFTFQSCLYTANLANFGFSFALSRQIAFIHGGSNSSAFRERSDFISTSAGWGGISELYAASRILFRWSLVVAAFLLATIFFIFEQRDKVELSTLPIWLVMGSSLLLTLNSQRFGSFLDGLGFMAYSRTIGGFYQLLWSALAIGTLMVRPSLILLATAVFISSLVQLVIFRTVLLSVGRAGLDRHRPVPPGLVKRLFRVAAPVGVVTSASFCVSAIQVPLIGLFLLPSLTAPYYIAQRIGQTLFSLFNQISQSQMPRFTQELGAADWYKAFHRMRRLLIFAGVGALGMGMIYWVASPTLVHIWLGPDKFGGVSHYVDSTILFFMAIDYALLAFTVPWAWFVLASGTNPFVFTTISNGVLNLILIGLLVPRFGLVGLPFAGIISGLASNHFYNIFKGGKLLFKLRKQMHSTTPAVTSERYVLMTDAIPLPESGNGIHVLGWNWLEAMKDETALILTPPLPHAAKNKKAVEETPVPIHFLPGAKFLNRLGWFSKLRGPAEVILFALKLPWICVAIRRSGATRIFAMAGAHFWFLAQVRLLRWCVRLPMEIYLVDDFESWQRFHGQAALIPLLRHLEKGTLRRMERVWAISQGYAEHLQKKYGVPARWLPVTARHSTVTYRSYQPQTPQVRSFVYIGAVNLIYRDALVTFAEVLAEMNRSRLLGYQALLEIYTYGDLSTNMPEWKDADHIRFHYHKSDETLQTALQEAWACVLPYAFQPESRLMVATSFSLKFTNALTSGRPIVFFGPQESAVISHALNHHLPLIATSAAALPAVLEQLPREDRPELIAQYSQLLHKFHSAQALRGYMAEPF